MSEPAPPSVPAGLLAAGPAATGPSATGARPASYRVLARKYRPQTFAELLGQEALVRTLSNAFREGRVAHAFILTGVRGVGKTSTARILARGLNCQGADGAGGPTLQPCGQCEPCRAIAEGRHLDVLEVDAASRTGVDDMREMLDGVAYRPVTARFKIYIIDEVHMLSKSAFNALLKTLEEPPEHVKFVFATTEIHKVPVTVLSRCQRFDLRRVPEDLLLGHFRDIARAEGVAADEAALSLIARAAEGSVRDGLSLLDQAIAHGDSRLTADSVRELLGLSSRAGLFDILDRVLAGDVPAALAALRQAYDAGADPVLLLQELLELTHWLTRLKLLPELASDPTFPEEERRRGQAMAARLEIPVLSRLWQALLKGLSEVRTAPHGLAALEMVLIRLAYMSPLPTPEELVRQLSREAGQGPSALPRPAPGNAGSAPPRLRADGEPAPPPGLAGRGPGGTSMRLAPSPAEEATPGAAPAEDLAAPRTFGELVALVLRHRELQLHMHLKQHVRLVRFEAERLVLRPLAGAPPELATSLTQKLRAWTDRQWVVMLDNEAEGEPSLREREASADSRLRDSVRQHPLVQAALAAFPQAEIKRIADLPGRAAPRPVAPPPEETEEE